MRSPSLSCLFVFLSALLAGVAYAKDDAQRAQDAVIVRTLQRLPGVDLGTKPEAKAALLRHLATINGTDSYFDLIEKFNLRDMSPELLRLATEPAESALGVKAARLL